MKGLIAMVAAVVTLIGMLATPASASLGGREVSRLSVAVEEVYPPTPSKKQNEQAFIFIIQCILIPGCGPVTSLEHGTVDAPVQLSAAWSPWCDMRWPPLGGFAPLCFNRGGALGQDAMAGLKLPWWGWLLL